MAGPFLLSCIKPLKRPSDDKLHVKHVILDKEIRNPPLRSREVKNCLMIHQLLSEAGGKQNLWDKLLIVEFSSYSEDEINSILSRGIEFDGSHYCFLGFSASQLKAKTCFLISETDNEVGDRRAKFGMLSDEISFADQASKVERMFEPFERSLRLKEDEFKIERNACTKVPSGLMSPELAETIKTESGLANAPSVVQVICPGFSGKLVLSHEIHTKASEANGDFGSLTRIKALLRIPGEADNGGNSLTMGIADCTKPYKVGYLDVFSVMFLKELGVKRDYLLALQSFYHQLLENLGEAELTHTKYFLRLNGRKELLSKIENGIPADAREKICKIKCDEIKEMQDHDRTKLRVLVSKSREVFGIVDPYDDKDNALKSDECVFIPCLDCLNPQEREQFEKAEQVLVIPVPCYSPSGIRVLKLVRDKGEYDNFKDCLVLPSQPEEHQVVANSYFVCWDKNLMADKSKSLFEHITNALPSNWSQLRKKLPPLPCSRVTSPILHRFEEMVTCGKEMTKTDEPLKTDEPSTKSKLQENEKNQKTEGTSTKSKLRENEKFQNDLKEYFSTFKSNDGLVSRAKSLFEKFASHPKHGPSCSACQKLGEYLSPDFAWNATSYDAVEKYLEKLEKKFEDLSSAQEEACTTQSEMITILSDFMARSSRQSERPRV